VTHEQEQILPTASVLGVGAVTALGRSLDGIARRLGEPPVSQTEPLRVNDQWLVRADISARLRRADRFVRMAVIAALDAWADAARTGAGVPMERAGLIMASGLGPHVRSFHFLDGILDYGDSAALPTDFSHSVHGTASAYIAELLGLRGPSLSITDFENGIGQALLLAQCWLAEGRCERVLVGAAEELGEVMVYCVASLLGDRRIIPGEGAVFLTLGPHDMAGAAQLDAAAQPRSVDLLMLEEPPLRGHSSDRPVVKARHTTTFSPYFGYSASGPAFQLLGGLLAMRGRQPLGKRIERMQDTDHPGGSIDSAAAFMPSSTPSGRMMLLTRSDR
jgi:3-oxoacyl-[acyl-carrier-protein] synthase II